MPWWSYIIVWVVSFGAIWKVALWIEGGEEWIPGMTFKELEENFSKEVLKSSFCVLTYII